MTRPPLPAMILGAAGLIPFVSLAISIHMGAAIWADHATQAVLVYGAVILSFMGGCRWGFACAGLGDGPRFWPLAVSVAPALLAWGAALVGDKAGLLMLSGGLLLLFVADEELTRTGGAPEWWSALRAPLSVIAALSLFAAALA
ncbi:DUF3429 domain-containing protein [Rhodovulum sp. DZ06]|uniref:DUF3429 domain-containing protein n=1 Tax=Rhodovulum sp. DZ06 TaxID=3425126 RepID=UPI003D34AE89